MCDILMPKKKTDVDPHHESLKTTNYMIISMGVEQSRLLSDFSNTL
jgi:hypothetical protein